MPNSGAAILVDTIAQKRVVVACDERAAARGVTPGMTLAHARARLSEAPRSAGSQLDAEAIWIGRADPDADRRALTRLAEWAMRFSPLVAPDPPDGLLLDATGCRRLYRGYRRMLHRIAGELDRLGLTARLAIAPTLGAAWAIARFEPGPMHRVPPAQLADRLAPLPVASLRLAPETVAALAELGVQRIGELTKLKRSDLAARFDDLPLRLDQAMGWRAERFTPLPPPERIEAAWESTSAITQPEAVAELVDHLLRELLDDLAQRRRGVIELELHFRRLHQPPWRRRVTLSRPTRQRRHLRLMLAPHVERLPLGDGVERVRLRARRTARLHDRQITINPQAEPDAEPDAEQARAWGELLDQFAQRLGAERTTRPIARPTHQPEAAFTRAPLVQTRQGETSEDQNDAGSPATPSPAPATFPATPATPAVTWADRPSRLLARPEPATALTLHGQDPTEAITPPRELRWRGQRLELVHAEGPERLAMPWWDRTGDDAHRDYYRALDALGRGWWIFRDHQNGGWWIHGQWA